jgi:ribosomal protein L35
LKHFESLTPTVRVRVKTLLERTHSGGYLRKWELHAKRIGKTARAGTRREVTIEQLRNCCKIRAEIYANEISLRPACNALTIFHNCLCSARWRQIYERHLPETTTRAAAAAAWVRWGMQTRSGHDRIYQNRKFFLWETERNDKGQQQACKRRKEEKKKVKDNGAFLRHLNAEKNERGTRQQNVNEYLWLFVIAFDGNLSLSLHFAAHNPGELQLITEEINQPANDSREHDRILAVFISRNLSTHWQQRQKVYLSIIIKT